ncbi:furin-1-like [Uloborus diversus]|uniref:furin-1-like n=1 Tax=Uloborus diversus TaxID=327109 RepID=UPI00240A903F|nr:furin-1-like [Uloborus diversus]
MRIFFCDRTDHSQNNCILIFQASPMSKICFSLLVFKIFVCVFQVADSLHTNEFAVRIDGGDDIASDVANKLGFINRGQVGNLKGYYLFEHHEVQKRSLSPSIPHFKLLQKEPSVIWVEQQEVKKRVKRSVESSFPDFQDPLYSDQWFLHKGGFGGYDMNVIPAWREGFTGKGVVISILDDGIQGNHPDLAQNYDKDASWDINDSDDDPTPKDDDDNKHGTRCAGEVSAVANNEFCGVGVAYNSSIGGVRMLDGAVTDYIEATALSLKPNHIHIYSASWGPEDNGKTVDGPGQMARAAFEDGIKKGRNGLGSIYVWASGNGGRHSDNCNCDGYTNSIYTISVSSATQSGLKPWYLEECSSTLTTTYSSGALSHDQNIVTVDVDFSYFEELRKGMKPNTSNLCTRSHTGTSASAPIAAGICALALEANPRLTWRDLQHLIVLTSQYEPLRNEKDWVTNGVERQVSTKFGYGLMDAAGMVQLAKKWKTVPKQKKCVTPSDSNESVIPAVNGEKLETSMSTDACKNKRNYVVYLEHVQVYITLSFHPRGNLHIVLISPSGTKSSLLLPRPHDKQDSTFKDWPFMSVHFWGENPRGTWKLHIINAGNVETTLPGKLTNWTLVFYGTEKKIFNPSTVKEPVVGLILDSSLERAHPTRGLNKITSSREVGCAKSEKFKITVNEQSDCTSECPVDHYGSLKDNTCHACDKSCLSCYGPSYNNCLTCPAKYFLQKNICVKSCPDNFFSDVIKKQCYPCMSSCASCEDSYETCSSCKPGLFMYSKNCLAACPSGTYQQQFHCKPCHGSCSSCYGPDSSSCATCASGYVLHNSTCLPECPVGFFSDRNLKCTKCHRSCKTCTDDSFCTTYNLNWELSSSGPVWNSVCPQGYFDDDSERCEACYLDCEQCSGPSIEDCIYCDNNYLWFNGQCVMSCPDGFFSKGDECHSCNEMCARCQHEENNCITCKNNFFLHHGSCFPSCPSGFFNNEQGWCEKCHSFCLDCVGGSDHNCTSCLSGFFLFNGSCMDNCPEGFFPVTHGDNSECMPCHFTCTSCYGFGTSDCKTCFQNSTHKDGICIPCLDGEFYNDVTKNCEICHSECGRCFGPLENECMSCPAPFRLHEAKHICLPCCINSESSSKKSDCCMCSNNLDVCVLSDHPRSIVVNIPSVDYEVELPLKHIVPFIIAVCASVVLLFVMVFGILQARSVGLCHFKFRRPRYERVPNPITAKFDADMEKISLTREDLEDEDDIYEKV